MALIIIFCFADFSNWWICQIFQDGDYNQELTGQFEVNELKTPTICSQSDFITGTSVLCESCAENQVLKLRQIAAFVPFNEVSTCTPCSICTVWWNTCTACGISIMKINVCTSSGWTVITFWERKNKFTNVIIAWQPNLWGKLELWGWTLRNILTPREQPLNSQNFKEYFVF